MTTNIDRAALTVWEASRGVGEPLSGIASYHIAAVLADATPSLLLPDLPEPTRWKQHKEPEWDACDTTVFPAGYEGRVVVEEGAGSWEATAVDIRALALAMLAAAKYAEENA